MTDSAKVLLIVLATIGVCAGVNVIAIAVML